MARIFTALVIVLSALCCMTTRPIVAQDGKKEDDVLLRDYQPESMLRVRANPVERAKFPVIDFHGHLRRATPERAIEIMDRCNMKMIVDYDGYWGSFMRSRWSRSSSR